MIEVVWANLNSFFLLVFHMCLCISMSVELCVCVCVCVFKCAHTHVDLEVEVRCHPGLLSTLFIEAVSVAGPKPCCLGSPVAQLALDPISALQLSHYTH